jgi:hypothetical protein
MFDESLRIARAKRHPELLLFEDVSPIKPIAAVPTEKPKGRRGRHGFPDEKKELALAAYVPGAPLAAARILYGPNPTEAQRRSIPRILSYHKAKKTAKNSSSRE